MLKTFTKTLAVTAVAIGGSAVAWAAGGGDFDYKMKHPSWSFHGISGTYDPAAMRRGYQVYREVCSSCHALDQLAFRHLGDPGGPLYYEAYPNPNDNPYVKAIAADWTIEDIDSETGDVIERKGVPADEFPPIYPNVPAARAANGGALPPDLSLMVAARTGGADYLYNLLIAYDEPKPDDVKLTPGLYWNPVMDGGKIAMASPLSEGIIDYPEVEIDDGHGGLETLKVEATVDQMAKDVTHFLAWSADPKLEQRKRAGFAVMLYLFVLTVLLYLSYKRVWRNVEH
jgi:cytochrome c1